MFRLALNITGTAPGTARGISQIIHDIQITNEKGAKVASIDGQALGPACLESLGASGSQELLMQDQWYVDNVTAATGVTATGVYGLFNDFPGTLLTCTFNFNASTATGYTAVTATSITLTGIAIESHTVSKPHMLMAEYLTNIARYTGKVAARGMVLAADNAELSTIVTGLTIGGSDFTAPQCAMAEEAFNATVPTGILPSGVASAFTGLATKGPVNPQTGNQLGIARFTGGVLAPAQVTFNTSPTFYVIQRVPIPA